MGFLLKCFEFKNDVPAALFILNEKAQNGLRHRRDGWSWLRLGIVQ
jgi:hypothetical protein